MGDLEHRATRLRQRAAQLRRLADELERMPAMRLLEAAGVDTWRGRRPDLCEQELLTRQRRVHEVADDLRLRAWQFERRADELDAAATSSRMTDP